nr:gluconate:H+ symporter [Pedobacter sp. ASV19]
MLLTILIGSVLLLLCLILVFKINALFALIITSIIAGLLQGMTGAAVVKSIEEGIGSTLGQLALILAMGAVLGKLLANGGAAQQITTYMVRFFGVKNLQWAMVVTGLLVGIPLFYNVGFVVLVPFVFMICASTGLSVLYVAIPLLTALSVTHGYLPPHPGATAIAILYKADIGKTMMYGGLICIPAIVIGGPLFSRTLKQIKPNPPKGLFNLEFRPENELPGFGVSLITSLLPVFLIGLATVTQAVLEKGSATGSFIAFIGHPVIALLISTFFAIYTMGIRQGQKMKDLMEQAEEALKSITMLLFIIGAAGAFKQVLVDGGIGDYISKQALALPFSPLLLVWFIAAAIRVALGSATVAGLTTAGIAIPIMQSTHVSPELMVLATGAGSLMFSHLNDPGFWMFKEYFGLSIRDTIRSWSLMETIVSVVGLIGVLILNIFI